MTHGGRGGGGCTVSQTTQTETLRDCLRSLSFETSAQVFCRFTVLKGNLIMRFLTVEFQLILVGDNITGGMVTSRV